MLRDTDEETPRNKPTLFVDTGIHELIQDACEEDEGFELHRILQLYPDGFLPPHWFELALRCDTPFPPADPGTRSGNKIGGLHALKHYQAWHGGYRSPATWFRGAPPRVRESPDGGYSLPESPRSGSSYHTAPDSAKIIRQRLHSAVAASALASHNMMMEKNGRPIVYPQTPPTPPSQSATPHAVRRRPWSATASFGRKARTSAVDQAQAAAWAALGPKRESLSSKCSSPQLDNPPQFESFASDSARKSLQTPQFESFASDSARKSLQTPQFESFGSDSARKSPQDNPQQALKGGRLSLKSRAKGTPMVDYGATANEEKATTARRRISIGKPRQSFNASRRMSRKVTELHKQLNKYSIAFRRRGQGSPSDSDSSSELTSDVVTALHDIFHHGDDHEVKPAHKKEEKSKAVYDSEASKRRATCIPNHVGRRAFPLRRSLAK